LCLRPHVSKTSGISFRTSGFDDDVEADRASRGSRTAAPPPPEHFSAPGGIVVFVLGNVRKCDVFRYWTAVTTSEPAFVRAWRSGRYMSSTDAAGCTKWPGVTARTM